MLRIDLHLVVGLALGYSCFCQTPSEDGLAAHYPFDAGGGLTVFDRAGNDVNGAIVGARFRPSPRGFALVFDGVDDVVDFGTPNGLCMTGDMSLTVWVKTDVSVNPGTQRLIFGDTAPAAVQRNYNLRLDGYGQLWFGWGDGKDAQHLAVKASMMDGRWRHVAVTCDHGARRVAMYVDGVRVAEDRLRVPITAVQRHPMKMGQWRKTDAFAGAIDDLRLYRRALTSADIAAIYRTTGGLEAVAGKGDVTNADGLRARYTFDTDQGTVLVDRSGHGNDGTIHGATPITSPWGRALRFDGDDDYVDLGESDGLALGGDMTIEIWIRTHYRANAKRPKLAKHRLIVGTNASLAVDRNYSLRLDHHDDLLFEYHGGTGHPLFTMDASFLNGDWCHLVAVIESGKHFYLFANGRLVSTRELTHDLAALSRGPVHIGGWPLAYLKADIDELRLYNRALTMREIYLNGGGDPASSPATIHMSSAGYSYARGAFDVQAYCLSTVPDVSAVLLHVTSPEGTVVKTLRTAVDPGEHAATGRLRITETIPAEIRRTGQYSIDLALLDSEDNAIGRQRTTVRCVASPPWLGNSIGLEDRVFPPHQPLQVKAPPSGPVLESWGRQHVFGSVPLLQHLTSAGRDLLRGPVRFTGRHDGKEMDWIAEVPDILENAPHQSRLSQACRAGALAASVKVTMDYDGFMTVDLSLGADRRTTVEALAVEFSADT